MTVSIPGDVMYDIFSRFENSFNLNHKFNDYSLLTLHRAENTIDYTYNKIRLDQIRGVNEEVIFPIGSSKKIISSLDIKYSIKFKND